MCQMSKCTLCNGKQPWTTIVHDGWGNQKPSNTMVGGPRNHRKTIEHNGYLNKAFNALPAMQFSMSMLSMMPTKKLTIVQVKILSPRCS